MPLWITGHSLGGAMATLASVRLASEGYKVRAVYTYGSPRVGDRFFRDSYRLANYRFVNDNDLVPHLPFRWCYKHVGKLRLVDGNGDFTEEQAAWVAKKRALADKAKRVQRAHRGSTGALHVFSDFDWLADHHLDRYLGAIQKLLPQLPNRRRPDQPGGDLHDVPPRSHRFDPASPGVPPPLGGRTSPRKLVISEADFIAAFGNQPQGRFGRQRLDSRLFDFAPPAEKRLLAQTDRLAKKLHVPRAVLLAQGLQAVVSQEVPVG